MVINRRADRTNRQVKKLASTKARYHTPAPGDRLMHGFNQIAGAQNTLTSWHQYAQNRFTFTFAPAGLAASPGCIDVFSFGRSGSLPVLPPVVRKG